LLLLLLLLLLPFTDATALARLLELLEILNTRLALTKGLVHEYHNPASGKGQWTAESGLVNYGASQCHWAVASSAKPSGLVLSFVEPRSEEIKPLPYRTRPSLALN
jgi:hypothetical protein